jgi:hypothetical protein
VIDLYDRALVQVDQAIGSVIQHLEKTSLLKNSIVILMSDHGEYLDENDLPGRHGLFLSQSDADLKTVLSFYIPKHLKHIPPQTVSALVRTIDTLPSLLPLMGLETPISSQGTDLFKRIDSNGKVAVPRLSAFAETDLAFNAEKEFENMNVISYPKATELLEPELETPGFFRVKPKYESLVKQVKWRKLITSEGSLIYKPTPGHGEFHYYPAQLKQENTPIRRKLIRQIKREMLQDLEMKFNSQDLIVPTRKPNL